MMQELFRHLLESTVFVAVVSLLPLLMRKRSAAARHTLWLIAASKFAVPAAVFSAAGSYLRLLFHTPPVSIFVSSAFSGLLSSSSPPTSGTSSLREAWALLAVVWLVGAVAMLAFWFHKMSTAFHSPAPILDLEKEALSSMQQRIGLPRAVRLRASRAKVEPGLSGVLHPTITIPQGLSAHLTRAEFDAVLLHELAHAKRRDNLTGAFVHALVCVFWFHPLLWWIERRLATECELACDELVVRHIRAREEYVAGILKVCRFQLSQVPAGVCRIVGPDLKNRMEGIMSFQSCNSLLRTPRLLVGVLASVMTIVPLAFGFLGTSNLYAQADAGSQPAPGTRKSKTPTCVFAGKSYLEGTVVMEEGTNHQQICMAHANGEVFWNRTDNAARERSRRVIVVPRTPVVNCEPKPSSSPELCACQSGVFSIGSIVDSANGKLYCDKGRWRPATRGELGLK